MFYQLPGNSSKSLINRVTTSRGFNRLFGLYRGIVEKTNDTFKIGYVRVRIPTIHTNEITIDDLPLAYVSQPFGGGKNYGSFIIPPVGSSVFVMFENGDPEVPIIIGTWYGDLFDEEGNQSDTEVPKSIKNSLIKHTQTKKDTNIVVQQETQEDEPYSSDDALFKEFRGEPRNLIIKSKKGHSIELDDSGTSDAGNAEDGQSSYHNEGMRFTTRNGQVIHIIDQPGNECILIKNADKTSADGEIIPGNYIQIDQKTNNINILSNKDINEEVKDNKILHVISDYASRIDKNKETVIGIDKTETIANNWNVNVGANITVTCLGTMLVNAMGPLLVNTGGSATMKCSGNVDMSVEGSVNLDVTGPISMTGSTIDLN